MDLSGNDLTFWTNCRMECWRKKQQQSLVSGIRFFEK